VETAVRHTPAAASLLDTLSEIHELPLDRVPAAQAEEIVRRVVGDPDRVTVDVARFNSSI
jgi:hypothetical protein